MPITVSYHCNSVSEIEDFYHTRHRLGSLRVKFLDGPPKYGAMFYRGIKHARHFHINTELGTAFDLRRNLDTGY